MASKENDLPPIPSYPSEKSHARAAGMNALDIAAEIASSAIPGLSGVKNAIVEKLVRAPLENRRTAFHDA